MKIAFSVLSYSPSYIANENINVGILFHELEKNIVHFELTTNWTRVRNFDDEINIEIFKLLLEGMKTHAERNVKSLGLPNYIKRYNNELKFGEVFYKNTDSIDAFILETKQMFMPYDFEKSKRPTELKQINYIKGLLKDSDVKYNTKTIKGNYDENVKYDYMVNDYGFKLFEFENKKSNKIISTAKHWAYTAYELKDICKTIFIYDIDRNDEIFNSTIKILKSSGAEVMKKDEALSFILKTSGKEYKTDQIEFGNKLI